MPAPASPDRRARRRVAEVVHGCILAGDEWTWKNDKGEEDPELTEALRRLAAKLAK